MNDRIRELAEQALNTVSNKRMLKDGQLERTWDPHEYDRVFAELIIRECCSIADDWVNNYNDGENYPSERIKEHFGRNQ
jgi:hypothetical protein